MRVHTDGSGVEDGIELFGWQSLARNGFAAADTGELASGDFATGADGNRGTGTSEREGGGAGGAACPENQDAAIAELDAGRQRAEDGEIIGVAAVQGAISTDSYGVDRTNLYCQRIARF